MPCPNHEYDYKCSLLSLDQPVTHGHLIEYCLGSESKYGTCETLVQISLRQQTSLRPTILEMSPITETEIPAQTPPEPRQPTSPSGTGTIRGLYHSILVGPQNNEYHEADLSARATRNFIEGARKLAERGSDSDSIFGPNRSY